MSQSDDTKSLSPTLNKSLNVGPPKELLQPFRTESSLLMNPGPTNITQRVTAATTMPIISFNDPNYKRLLKDISSGIRYVFQTRNDYSFAITGSGTCAMETALCNLLEKNDRLLVTIHGLWGERISSMGVKHGYNVVELRVPKIGDVFEINQIEREIEKHRPKLLYICHGDSTTGTLQPLRGIGSICHKYNCLLLVDAVISLCSAPISTDQLEIDAIYSGAQKALSGPPGVSLISLSPRAIEVIMNRKTQIDSFYMDIKLLSKAWGIAEINKFVYHHTPAITLMYGLREALAMVAEEGLDNVIGRHLKYSLIIQSELEKMGLKILVKEPKYRLSSLLAVIIPDYINGDAVKEYLFKHYNISISLGLGPSFGKVWRIGILGENANQRSAKILCVAFKEALEAAKKLQTKL